MVQLMPEYIYKVAAADEFAAARQSGSYTGAPIDRRDGFIHFSTAAQLPETIRLHFKDRHDLILAAVRTRDLGPALKWEPSRGGQLFPHLYGELPMQRVDWVEAIDVDEEGRCRLPDRIG
ncbi:MAG: DUF952 domain-containing protein [Devosia sp.]|jgi:uncharacterized protein (DUF952 family)